MHDAQKQSNAMVKRRNDDLSQGLFAQEAVVIDAIAREGEVAQDAMSDVIQELRGNFWFPNWKSVVMVLPSGHYLHLRLHLQRLKRSRKKKE